MLFLYFAFENAEQFPWSNDIGLYRKMLCVAGDQIGVVLLKNDLVKRNILHIGKEYPGRRRLKEQTVFSIALN